MSELAVVLVLIAVVAVFAWMRTMDAAMTVWIVIGLLNLINLAVTYINLWQAWNRDRRFLSPWWLGLISCLVGAVMLAVFGLLMGSASFALWTGLPYLAGGLVVLVATAVFTALGKGGQADGEERVADTGEDPDKAG